MHRNAQLRQTNPDIRDDRRMRSIDAALRARGGVAATFELLDDGYTSHRLTAAVRRGEIIRVRQGHYACPDLPTPQIEALRIGGRLTGLAGARELGLWTPPTERIDLLVRPDARALRTRANPRVRLSTRPDRRVVVHWADAARGADRVVAPAIVCVRQVIRTEAPRVVFAVVESALHQGLISDAEWRRERDRMPARVRGRLANASRDSDSGGESLLKFELLGASIRFSQQTRIATVGRVDFLIGAHLVVEVDGAAFHTGREAFEEDRRRDSALCLLGYRTLRFTYNQVERRPTEVMRVVFAAMARGDHR